MAKVLFFIPWSPGYLGPAKKLSSELTELGFGSCIACPSDAASILSQEGFSPVPIENERILKIENWHNPAVVVDQLREMKNALSVSAAEIIVTTQFNPAYYFLKRQEDIRVIVIGMHSLLWPSEGRNVDLQRKARQHQRISDWCAILAEVQDRIGLKEKIDREILYGDAFLIRSIPELDHDGVNDTEGFYFVGSLFEDQLSSADWIRFGDSGAERDLCYFQHGRHFREASGWPVLSLLVENTNLKFVVDLERYDGEDLPPACARLSVRQNVPLAPLSKRLALIASSGGATACLFALENAIPQIVFQARSGSEDMVEMLLKEQLGFYIPSSNFHRRDALHQLTELLTSSETRTRLKQVASLFSRANSNRPKLLRKLIVPRD